MGVAKNSCLRSVCFQIYVSPQICVQIYVFLNLSVFRYEIEVAIYVLNFKLKHKSTSCRPHPCHRCGVEQRNLVRLGGGVLRSKINLVRLGGWDLFHSFYVSSIFYVPMFFFFVLHCVPIVPEFRLCIVFLCSSRFKNRNEQWWF